MLAPKPMEIVEHDLDCHCNRRREWIENLFLLSFQLKIQMNHQ